MKSILAAVTLSLATLTGVTCTFMAAPSIVRADEARFDFSSRERAKASYKNVFSQFSPAGSRAFERDVKKLVIAQLSPDGTVSGGRVAIKRQKPTPDQFYAAMARALDGKTASDVVAAAGRLAD